MKKNCPPQPWRQRYFKWLPRRLWLLLVGMITLLAITSALNGSQWRLTRAETGKPSPTDPSLSPLKPGQSTPTPTVLPSVIPTASPVSPLPTVPSSIPPSPSSSPAPDPLSTPIIPTPAIPSPPTPTPTLSPSASPIPSPQPTPTVQPTSSPSPSPTPPKPKPPVSTNSLSIPAQFRGKIIRMVRLLKKEKVVALTFDDGPWSSTTQVLEILKKNKIKATFFWIGKHLQMYPEIAKKVVADGHTIGNHTWSHLYKSMEPDQVKAEVDNTTASIFKKTGAKTVFFRPPGGELKNGLVEYAVGKKYVTALWSVSPGDAKKGVSTEQIVSDVVKNARSGSVILLHDGGGDRSKTIEALPQIIVQLRAKGYKFISLPELLRIPGAKAQD
ncbi:MAG: polysaccharide deacetylase family protein [Aphanocapsa sp. GSE-SYN-MK-11-07L]|nr:polysaccharide deacetylase family protein [Aphanocapsa sp. GSE-SYN-MK-11-07L]